MARDRNEMRSRLQDAAIELFGEQGYERTSAQSIAARAGVTERTYFRDKREVLFGGESELVDILTQALRDLSDERRAPSGPCSRLSVRPCRSWRATVRSRCPGTT
jgi:AcrR family transcriptional regulator